MESKKVVNICTADWDFGKRDFSISWHAKWRHVEKITEELHRTSYQVIVSPCPAENINVEFVVE